ncbi:hypothetical protein [Streptomyces sp. bgisy027]|uniref:hypothetical protein n=1 Tax=Streptomyces sp. bgisy027 TaxID=3413770 RepID=UPI003D71F0B5
MVDIQDAREELADRLQALSVAGVLRHDGEGRRRQVQNRAGRAEGLVVGADDDQQVAVAGPDGGRRRRGRRP